MNKNHDDDDSEHRRLQWCIGAARYAVAALVTAITLAVIARAVAVSLRSEELYINVGNGTVSVLNFLPNKVDLSITLQSYNPSGRVGLNYTGVNVSLLYSDGSLITSFVILDGIDGIMVAPDIVRQTSTVAIQDVPADVSQEFVDRMRNGTQVTDATVHLNGTLHTQISGDIYTRGHITQFRCYPVTIGNVSAGQLAAAGDVSCNEVS